MKAVKSMTFQQYTLTGMVNMLTSHGFEKNIYHMRWAFLFSKELIYIQKYFSELSYQGFCLVNS